MNPSHISNIECGRANPSLTALIKIANILQCSVDTFLNGEYLYSVDKDTDLDKIIYQKLQLCNSTQKEKIIKIIDIMIE